MNRLILAATGLAIMIYGCTTSKEFGSSSATNKNERKLAERMALRKAIEARRYILRMDKILLTNGMMIDIVPRNNYIIVNGEIVSVSLAYEGRSFGARRITGINFNGRTGNYIMRGDESKGLYNIHVEAITQSNDKFDIYFTLSENGSCSASVNNPYIQSVSYRGTIIPLTASITPRPEKPAIRY